MRSIALMALLFLAACDYVDVGAGMKNWCSHSKRCDCRQCDR